MLVNLRSIEDGWIDYKHIIWNSHCTNKKRKKERKMRPEVEIWKKSLWTVTKQWKVLELPLQIWMRYHNLGSGFICSMGPGAGECSCYMHVLCLLCFSSIRQIVLMLLCLLFASLSFSFTEKILKYSSKWFSHLIKFYFPVHLKISISCQIFINSNYHWKLHCLSSSP